MNKIGVVAKLIVQKKITSLLDVGCRENVLKNFLPSSINYAGNDLFQNEKNGVTYVGDILNIDLPTGAYEGVAALDILEHTDNPYAVFDKIAKIASKFVFVNFPNTYDLKSRWQILTGKRNDKYRFHPYYVLDRHRWMMHYDDIVVFYKTRAKELNMKLEIIDVRYGGGRRSALSSLAIFLRYALPKTLSTSSVIGIFEKQ